MLVTQSQEERSTSELTSEAWLGHLFVFANAKHSCPLTVNCREDPRHLGHFELSHGGKSGRTIGFSFPPCSCCLSSAVQPIGNATLT